MADKLTIWDVDSNIAVDDDFFDLGDVLRNSTDDITFAIKNESFTYTAKGIVLKVEDTGDISSQLLFSMDKWTYVDVLSVGDLPPTALSQEITMRRVTKSDAVSGNFDIVLEIDTWSIS